MGYKNTVYHYGSVAKFLHWMIALMVISLLAIGFIMTRLPKENLRFMIFNYHKLFGLAVLLLMIIRLTWKHFNSKPILTDQLSRWERLAATATHHSFYLLLIVMPLSGWIMSSAAGYYPTLASWRIALPGVAKSKATASVAGDIHEIIAWVLIVLICIHILAALKHHFIDKSALLIAMLPSFLVKGR